MVSAMGPKSSPRYYYADGGQVSLDPDPDYLAVYLCRVDRERLKPLNVTVVGDVGLLPAARVPKQLLGALRDTGALLPVYKAAGARIAVLPEVRVELSGKKQHPALRAAIKASGIDATVEPTGGDSFVLRPRSGSGADALSLANFVHEHVHPPMVQARFLRILPKPTVLAR
jgi:hypothetical protein